ncbi:unnamed protein product [Prunus armeniaca]
MHPQAVREVPWKFSKSKQTRRRIRAWSTHWLVASIRELGLKHIETPIEIKCKDQCAQEAGPTTRCSRPLGPLEKRSCETRLLEDQPHGHSMKYEKKDAHLLGPEEPTHEYKLLRVPCKLSPPISRAGMTVDVNCKPCGQKMLRLKDWRRF